MINLPPIRRTSLLPFAWVLKEHLQVPVEMSHVLTTPAESLEMTTASLACTLMDSIDEEVGGVDFVFVTTASVDDVPICQNLTVLSSEAETREEENARELMKLACPTRVSTRQEREMSQTNIVLLAAPTTNLPSGEKQQESRPSVGVRSSVTTSPELEFRTVAVGPSHDTK